VCREIGENRVQEALGKYTASREARFHLIGPLQSNKAKKAVEFFDLIQSLDRLELAQDLDRHAREAGKVQDCLVQIKISEEATKSGLNPGTLPEFLEKLRGFSGLRNSRSYGNPAARCPVRLRPDLTSRACIACLKLPSVPTSMCSPWDERGL